ncbi:MAG: hypothetical protein N2C14_03525, partial [Planctomycetales bacterium]
MSQTLDPRNEDVLNWVDGSLIRKYDPAVPVFDSGFMHGKLVWSSPRLIQKRIFRLQEHLNKIRHSAELNFWPLIPSDGEIKAAIRETLSANGMEDGVHIRIMLTAGNQATASMDIDAVTDAHGKP